MQLSLWGVVEITRYFALATTVKSGRETFFLFLKNNS